MKELQNYLGRWQHWVNLVLMENLNEYKLINWLYQDGTPLGNLRTVGQIIKNKNKIPTTSQKTMAKHFQKQIVTNDRKYLLHFLQKYAVVNRSSLSQQSVFNCICPGHRIIILSLEQLHYCKAQGTITTLLARLSLSVTSELSIPSQA